MAARTAASAQSDRCQYRTTSAAIASAARDLGTAQAALHSAARAAESSLAGGQYNGLLKREGLTVSRRVRRKTPPYTQPFQNAIEPNQLWCADFKGWFRTRDQQRIDPLTISDAASRDLLRCQAVEKTNTEQVLAICEAAFREHGLPLAIRTDNGPPFASRAVAGLSVLSIYWMKLGIIPAADCPWAS